MDSNDEFHTVLYPVLNLEIGKADIELTEHKSCVWVRICIRVEKVGLVHLFTCRFFLLLIRKQNFNSSIVEQNNCIRRIFFSLNTVYEAHSIKSDKRSELQLVVFRFVI